MSSCMIGHRFGYSSIGSPYFQDVIDVGVSGQMLEDKAASIVFPAVFTSGYPSSCLHAERYMYWLFALVHDDGKYPSVVVLRYVTPFQFTDITESQTTVAGKEICVLNHIVFTRCRNQSLHFVYGQIVSFPFARFCPFVM